MTAFLTLAQVDELAARAHAGQVDACEVAYVDHVRAVADALAPFGEHLVMAGLLHDVIEDTDWTAEALLAAGVPPRVVAIVAALTKGPDTPYDAMIRAVAADPQAALVKIADNAHNSRSDRNAALVKIADNAHNSRSDRNAALSAEQRERFTAKYAKARATLWPAVDPADLRVLLERVNPDLLADVSG